VTTSLATLSFVADVQRISREGGKLQEESAWVEEKEHLSIGRKRFIKPKRAVEVGQDAVIPGLLQVPRWRSFDLGGLSSMASQIAPEILNQGGRVCP
jgi:hypothetical protein